MVYYGDEVAVNSPSLASSGNGPIGDPYTRPPYPWLDQPGDPTVYGPPDTSVESYYTKLAHLRKQYPALRNGSFVTLLTGDTQAAQHRSQHLRLCARAERRRHCGDRDEQRFVQQRCLDSGGEPVQRWHAIAGCDQRRTYSVSGGNVAVTLARAHRRRAAAGAGQCRPGCRRLLRSPLPRRQTETAGSTPVRSPLT